MLNQEQLILLAQNWALRPGSYKELTDSHAQGRTYISLESCDEFNAWAIRWADGFDSSTGFHDHDVSAAGIVVVSGEVVEERLSLGDNVIYRHRPGHSYFLPPSVIHDVRDGGSEPAITIHTYSPPLLTQGIYKRGEDGALIREVVSSTTKLKTHKLRSNG